MDWRIVDKVIEVKQKGKYVEFCEALEVLSLTHNLSSLETTLKIRIRSERLVSTPFTINLGELSKGLLPLLIAHGLTCMDFPENEELIIEILQALKSDAKVYYVHENLGFLDFDDKEVFFLHHPVGNIEDRIKGSCYCFAEKTKSVGDFWTWHRMVDNEIIGNVNLELALSLAALAPVAHILFTEGLLPNIPIVALIGDSSTGKTTVLKLVASAWGNPSENTGIISDLNATQNAFFAQFGRMKGFPFLIDETTAEADLNFDKIIYYLPKGRGKLRCNSDGSLKDTNVYTGAVMFTGETSIFKQCSSKAGLRARLLELSLPWTNDAKHADRIGRVISCNYGKACYLLVPWIMNNKERIITLYKKYETIFRKSIPSSSGIDDRLLKIYSSIMVSAIAIKRSLMVDLDVPGIKRLLTSLHKSTTVDLSDETLMSNVNLWLLQNNSKFPPMETSENTNVIWGEVGVHRQFRATWVIDSVFEKFVQENIGISLNKVKKILSQRGMMYKSSDRHYKFSRNIAGREVYCYILYTNKSIDILKKERKKKKIKKTQVNLLIDDKN